MTETVRMSDNPDYEEEAAVTGVTELSRAMGRGALYLVEEKAEPAPAETIDEGLEIITYSVSAQQRAANQQTVKPRGLRRGL